MNRSSLPHTSGSTDPAGDISGNSDGRLPLPGITDHLASVIDSAMDAIVTVNESLSIVTFNRAAERMFQCDREKAIGNSLDDFIPERFRTDLRTRLQQTDGSSAGNGPSGAAQPFYGLRCSGEEFPVEASISQAEAAGVKFYTVIMRDVTERLQAEEESQKIREELDAAQRIAHVGSWNWEPGQQRATLSDELFRIFGLEPSDTFPGLEEVLRVYVHPEDRAFVGAALEKAFTVCEPFDMHYRIVRADGEVRVVHSRGEGIKDENGRARRLFGTAQDVTDRIAEEEHQRRLLEKIAEQQERLRTIVDSVPGVVWESSLSSRSERSVNFVSDYIETMLGYSVSEWLSEPGFGAKIVHPDDHERVEREVAEILKARNSDESLEFRWVMKNGGAKWVQSRISVITDKNGTPTGLRGVTVDITDRKMIEQALKSSEARYRHLFANNPLPMWVYDLETLRFLEVNEAAVQRYGYTRDEFLRMSIRDIRPQEDLEELAKDTASVSPGLGTTRMWRHQTKDGRLLSVEVTAHSTDFNGRKARLVLANDVTERRQLEDQLRQSQKMEAVGLLAGGIAHDFNNLLTAINGYSDLLLRRLPADDPSRGALEQILKAGRRAAGLTGQLLAFSRKQILQPKVIDLNNVVTDMESLLIRIIGENIRFVTVLDEGLGKVNADPGQIEQTIMNLVVNARDAMPNGGTLTVETANVHLDADYARMHRGVTPGPYVMLGVSDTGIGMDAETRERIFEPFFSTKEAGKGTGLGMSTTYGIVRQTGGSIWVYSEPGKGTTVKIYLPQTAHDGAPEESKIHTSDGGHGTETVLLVEDEEFVRTLAQEVLETFGYTVLAVPAAKEAVLAAETHPGTIHLLLTDVVMPGLSGPELSSRITDLRPDIKVLFMSGYTDNAVLHHGVTDGHANFLQKPFSAAALAEKVREVLDSEASERT